MTNPIAQMIHAPESKTLEFKRDLSSPRPLLRTLVAFANSAGGRLVLGVADDRQVVGIDTPLDMEERLCNLIADSIAPRLVPNVELAEILPLSREQSRKTEKRRSMSRREQVGEQDGEQVNEQVVRILRACESEARTKADLLKAAGMASVYLNYRRHLVPLLEKGLIERTLPDKPTSRFQKYRLTDKGRRALEEKI